MEALELFVKVLLALLVVGFVGYPLLRQDWEEEVVEVPEELQELYRRKESTYSALKELEFDHKTGKLSLVDFQELDAKYRGEAIELLEAIDLAERGEEPKPRKQRKPLVERAGATAAVAEVSTADASGRQGRKSAGARAGAPARVGRGLVCAECDAENPANARFCASCGAALEQESSAKRARKVAGGSELACEDCGQPVSADHRFCAGCGAEVNF